MESVSQSKISDNEALVNYTELHNALRDTPRYRYKLSAKDENTAKDLRRLHNSIDTNWHHSQQRYKVNLQQDVPTYIDEINKLDGEKRKKIREDIGKEWRNIEKSINADLILKRLEKEGKVK